MTDATARDAYFGIIASERAPIVQALDRAILAAQPDLDVAVKYRQLMYTCGQQWRNWVCAIDAHPRNAVALRFLFGTQLVAPPGVLRPGSTTLANLDYAKVEDIDPELIADLVRQAVRYQAGHAS